MLNSRTVGKVIRSIESVDEGKCVYFRFTDDTSILVDSGGGDNDSLILQIRDEGNEPVSGGSELFLPAQRSSLASRLIGANRARAQHGKSTIRDKQSASLGALLGSVFIFCSYNVEFLLGII